MHVCAVVYASVLVHEGMLVCASSWMNDGEFKYIRGVCLCLHIFACMFVRMCCCMHIYLYVTFIMI